MLGLFFALLLIAIITVLLRPRPIWGLPALVFLLPFERIGSFETHLSGTTLTIRPDQLVGAALILVCLLEWRRLSFKFPIDKLELLPVIYLLAGVLSLSGAISVKRGLFVLGFSVFMWVLFLVVRRLAISADLSLLGKILGVTTLVALLFGLYQFMGDTFGLGIHWTGLREAYTKAVFGFPRIQSFAQEPLYLADFLLIPLGIFASLLLRKPNRRHALIVGLLSLVITMTLSRGGYAGSIMILIIVAVVFWSRRGALVLGGVVLAGILAGMLFISGATFWQQEGVQKIENFTHQATNVETGASVSERSQWRHMALDAFKGRPIFGIGIGNFGRWAHQQNPAVPEAAIVNNEPLELLAETGVVGFGAILAFVLAILWRSWRALREATDEMHRIWLVGLTAAVIGIGGQYQTFSTLYITYIWVALGLLVAVQDRIFGAFIPVDVKVEQEQIRNTPKRKKRRR